MYDSKMKSEDLDELFCAICSLKNEQECYMFFEDLCTVGELTAIAQRFKVAKMLNEKTTCQVIADNTGASTATISRVNKCLHYGTGGYRLVLNRKEEGK